MPEKHPIHAKYPELHKSPVVEKAATQHRRHGERIPNEPGPKLEAWLSDLEHIHTGRGASPERQAAQPEVLERIKQSYHRGYITGTDDDSVGRKLRRDAQIAENEGHGMAEEILQRVNEAVIEQTRETIQQDQERSLDAWIDYLTSDDATYPIWFKYYVFRNITKLASFDKVQGEFPKRSKGTTAPFPDINREALAYMEDSLAKHYGLKPLDPNNPETEIDPQTKELLDKEANFASLYKRCIDYAAPKTTENLDITDGEWVKFDQTNDPEEGKKLAHSLYGYGTGWCTAGEGTAQSQLAGGDFYVYYTKSEDGQYSVPRVAMRMRGRSIAEIRGIEADQNLEGLLVPIAEEKMNEVDPEGAEGYKKKAEDMRQLTDIYAKHEKGEELTKEDLRFIYELDGYIEGFGYGKDTRIGLITSTRNMDADLEKIFNTTEQNTIVRGLLQSEESRQFLVSNLNKFQGLDAQIAQKLIEAGVGWVVAENLGNFTGVDHNEIAQKLIEAGVGGAVAENLGNFTGVDHNQIAQQLIEAGVGGAVAENLGNFTGVDHNQIAQRIIEAGEGDAVATYFNNFTGLDNTTAQQLIEAGVGWVVAENLGNFTGVDHNQIAQQIIEAGVGGAVAKNLGNFTGVDHNQIAQELIEAGQGEAVLKNLDLFRDVTNDTVIMLLKSLLYYDVNKYSHVEDRELAVMLVEEDLIERRLGLPLKLDALYEKVKENQYIDPSIKVNIKSYFNLDKFLGLSPEIISKLQEKYPELSKF